MGCKKSILVADDEEDLRKVLSIRLIDAGYEVLEVDAAKATLRIAKDKSLNLIITDIMMPKRLIIGAAII